MERDSLLYKARRKCQVIAQKIMPDETMCKFYSRILLKKKVDLKNPKTFNEKIQWLKLHDYPNNQLVINGADKYKVREYVEKKGLGDILVPLLGIDQKILLGKSYRINLSLNVIMDVHTIFFVITKMHLTKTVQLKK